MAKTILQVRITTNLNAPDEVYEHALDPSMEKDRILDAVETLYGYEGVTRIDMELIEVED